MAARVPQHGWLCCEAPFNPSKSATTPTAPGATAPTTTSSSPSPSPAGTPTTSAPNPAPPADRHPGGARFQRAAGFPAGLGLQQAPGRPVPLSPRLPVLSLAAPGAAPSPGGACFQRAAGFPVGLGLEQAPGRPVAPSPRLPVGRQAWSTEGHPGPSSVSPSAVNPRNPRAMPAPVSSLRRTAAIPEPRTPNAERALYTRLPCAAKKQRKRSLHLFDPKREIRICGTNPSWSFHRRRVHCLMAGEA
jgi:hypothetical protein